jgi:hypothetical protein
MSADAAKYGIDVQLRHQDKTDGDGENGQLVGCRNGVVFAGDSLHLRQAVCATRPSGRSSYSNPRTSLSSGWYCLVAESNNPRGVLHHRRLRSDPWGAAETPHQ